MFYVQPYKDKRSNISKLISEPLFTVGTFLMCAFPLYKETLSEYDMTTLSWIITLLFLGATLLEISTLYSKKAISYLKEKHKERKNKLLKAKSN